MAKTSLVRTHPPLALPVFPARRTDAASSFPLTCPRPPPPQSAQLHILRALAKWPKDVIRPQVQLQDVLRKRFEGSQTGLTQTEQLKQANALYSLLDNRYKKKARSFPGDKEDVGPDRHLGGEGVRKGASPPEPALP